MAAATVRLFMRRGYDWTDRYPAIAGAAAKLRARSFTLDGEAVVCGSVARQSRSRLNLDSPATHSQVSASGRQFQTCLQKNFFNRQNVRSAPDLPLNKVRVLLRHDRQPRGVP